MKDKLKYVFTIDTLSKSGKTIVTDMKTVSNLRYEIEQLINSKDNVAFVVHPIDHYELRAYVYRDKIGIRFYYAPTGMIDSVIRHYLIRYSIAEKELM